MMASASDLSSSDQPGAARRRFALPRRTVALAITLLVHILLLIMLLTLSPARIFAPMGSSRLISIAISPAPSAAARAKSPTKAKQRAAKAEPAAASKSAPPPVVPLHPTQSVPDVPLIPLTHDEIVGLDATLHAHHAAEASADAGTGGAADSAKAGTGPSGQQLYAAEWYREPTQAELRFYMPANVRGWGEVGCRTVARYHVEDCVELGESPRGSGLSRFVREAAWQFLVRPPRVDGRLMIGEWVRIRITLVDKDERGGQ